MLGEMSRWVIRKESEGSLVIQAHDSKVAHLRRYNAGKVRLTLPFGHALPPHLEDLVDLALTVYAVDRLIRRSLKGNAGSPSKSKITKSLPVHSTWPR